MGELIARRDGHTGWITFSNAAKHNAMSYAMWCALPEALHQFDSDPEIRVIALTGAGDRAFVSGADISEFEHRRASADASAEYNRATKAATEALGNAAKPTVAVIRGICFGGGVGLAVSCDMRIARDDARFCVPAARLGLGYDYAGIKRLVDVVGPACTAEIFATSRRYSAAEALQMKLVNHALPGAGFEAFVAEYLGQIGGNAPLTIAAAMRAIDEALKPERAQDLRAVSDMVTACFASADYAEGRTAFMAKRKPVFRGR